MSELTMTTEYGTVNNNNQEVSTMNRSELIRAYVAANPNPDQFLCPEIIQYWKNAKKEYVNWSNKSGRRWENGSNWGGLGCNAIYYSPRSYSYTGMYFKYIPELKCLEVSNIRMDGGRGVDGVPRDWEYCQETKQRRYFAFIGDTAMYYADGTKEDGGKYYSQTFKKKIHNACLCGEVYNGKAIKHTLKQIDTSVDTENGYPCNIIETYYTKLWIPRKISQHVNQINEYELEDIIDFSSVPADIHNAIVVELLSDHILFRKYRQRERWDNTIRGHVYYEWDEQYRVFIDQKGKPTVVQKKWNYAEWKISTASIHSSNYGNPKIAVINEELMEQWTPVKYLKGIIDFHNDINALENLVMDLRHPIIEQLVKSGYPELAKDLACNNQVAANMKNYFRVEKEIKQPLYKLLGVNKWLLKAVEAMEKPQNSYYYRDSYRMDIIYKIKFLYDRFDISDLSKETIDLVLNAIKDMTTYDIKEIAGYGSWHYRRARWLTIDDDARNFIFKLLKMQSKQDGITRLYLDTMRVYDRIANKPEVNLRRFDDLHGLEILHDALVAIQVQEEEERQARYDAQRRATLEEQKKYFDKLQKERKEKYNAETDNFLIRVPDQLEEITQEGVSLCHCVGGYLGRHATGDTNIIFLRKKSSPSTPFYTIEVCGNTLVQIHGSHNKWLGNDPEAIPFVYKWLKERNIKFANHILLNLGAGYGASRESLNESYLTKEVK